jgi:hypothetical protein
MRLILSAVAMAAFLSTARPGDAPLVPHIIGNWWQIAGDPDLGSQTSPGQQPVDFGIWQAADGTWQLWSCIRGTKEPGHTRLFYRWEGANLTDSNWKPMGIALHADSTAGEAPGGLQAPYVFRDGARWIMFYGGWDAICSAASNDGKNFSRILNPAGKSTLFGADADNPRDPMVIRIGHLWHCYYTAHTKNQGADYCRTSTDLRQWSEPHLVACGGQSGDGPWSAECPFVVEPRPGAYYLFRNQVYEKDAKCSVYFSHDPLDFGINHDVGHFVCTLPCAAPEIIHVGTQYYIAALLPNLKGIQIAPLAWEPKTR